MPFGAVPGLRCSAFSLPLTVLDASRVAGFLDSSQRSRLGLLGTCSGPATWRDIHGACAFQCVARERRSDGVLCCSPSSAGSFLTAFSRAVRGISRQAMALSCLAPSKYHGCVAEAQVDGRGLPGVSRRLPLEVASGPDSRAICSCVSTCLRMEGSSRRPACVCIHQGTGTERYAMVAHGVCAVCASLGSSYVRVRAGVSQRFQLYRCLKELKRRNYGCS